MKQISLKEYIDYFDILFNDILFEKLDITLEYKTEWNVIEIYIDNILHGYIDYDHISNRWELYNKNFYFVNYAEKNYYYQTTSIYNILFNFIEKCIQRIEIEELLCR